MGGVKRPAQAVRAGNSDQHEQLREWTEIGRALCHQRQMTPNVKIGYGNNHLPEGGDPWGEACHIASVAFLGPGGPEILSAGKPTLGNVGWAPLLFTNTPYDGFTFLGRFTDFLTISMGTETGWLFTPEPVVIGPTCAAYYSWVGFLKELQDSGG